MFPSCEDAAHSKPAGAATRGDASWINKSQYFSLISEFYKQSIDIRRTCCAALAGCVASPISVVRVRARAHIIGEGHDVEEVQDPLDSLTCLLGLTWLSRVIKQQQEKPLAGHLLDWAWWAPTWPDRGMSGDWIRSESDMAWWQTVRPVPVIQSRHSEYLVLCNVYVQCSGGIVFKTIFESSLYI